MNIVSRALLAIFVLAAALSLTTYAQEQQTQIRLEDQPPAYMKYDRVPDFLREIPKSTHSVMLPKTAKTTTANQVGQMINAYTTESQRTNQIGYDPVTNQVTVFFRGGPDDVFEDDGRGELVYTSSFDNGVTWSDYDADHVWNSDLPTNVEDQIGARHPSIYLYNDGSTIQMSTVFGNLYQSFASQNAIIGQVAYKGGAYDVGPFQGGYFDQSEVLQYFPNRIRAATTGTNAGKLFSIMQTINPANNEYSGLFYVITSTDNGQSWEIDYTNPALSEDNLSNNYQVYGESVALDVSPDGNTIYIGFAGIFVEEGSFQFIDNQLGYVRSTNGGTTWDLPVMHPFDTWEFLPEGTEVNLLDGFFLPSMDVAVDGLGQPHFLLTVNGRDTFLPIDSTLIGEITIDPENPATEPKFHTISPILRPDYRRYRNPENATDAEQPKWSIWNEHEWAKTADGMELVAKWIDTEIYWVVDQEHQELRLDSLHDVFVCAKNISESGNKNYGWYFPTVQGAAFDGADSTFYRINISDAFSLDNTDEKFTKMNPIIADNTSANRWIHVLYTIQATGEFVPTQIYPDTDDLGTADLFLISVDLYNPTSTNNIDVYGATADPNSVDDGQVGSVPNGFELSQNYPNPFNPTTTISFNMPQSAKVKLRVFNMLGKEVATVFEGQARTGYNSFTYNAENLTSGNYFYRLEGENFSVTKIMTLMK